MSEEAELYVGEPGFKHDKTPALPASVHDLLRVQETYLPDDGLRKAVNVALLLGLPLLLTGPPGSGKTRLAYALATELNLGEPLEVVVKSDATSRDLLYSYDELGRFQDAQASSRLDKIGEEAANRPLLAYLRLQPLGEAILRAGGADAKVELLRGHAFRGRHADEAPTCFKDLDPDLFAKASAPGVSVVLIDELDKAPRDLPNDLLRELEDMAFEIRELGIRIRVPRDEVTRHPRVRPIVIITSNAERSLPEPFLRRVAFYDIPDPTDEKLRQIVSLRFHEMTNPSLINSVIKLFRQIEQAFPPGERRPGTAEFLAWFMYLDKKGLAKQADVLEMPDALKASVSVLAKTMEMQKIVEGTVKAALGPLNSDPTG